ncbi:alpha/beta fold hydrolase [Nesterenkonia sp. CL21]|nr:alpha/beta fold hydrolase [Nesterenkonia sp. CL21]MDS2173876.1 alpha/beta fold hydrolase [Nesterenkonia sp. CL21]
MSDDPTASDVAGAPALEATSLRETENPRLLLVLVPGLGTDVASTWRAAAAHLPEDVWAVGLDLPGHGRSAPWTDAPATPSMPQLARAVVDAVQRLRSTHPRLEHSPLRVAGTSLAGGLTLQLAAEHGAVVDSATVFGGLPRFGTAEAWRDRARQVLDDGTEALTEGSMPRWFSPAFRASAPEAVHAVMASLRAADDSSYAALCTVLSGFDLRKELPAISTPVHLVAGELDPVAPPEEIRAAAEAIPGARLTVVDGVAHQIAVERPQKAAELLSS